MDKRLFIVAIEGKCAGKRGHRHRKDNSEKGGQENKEKKAPSRSASKIDELFEGKRAKNLIFYFDELRDLETHKRYYTKKFGL
mgnify:CR=1 FL=1